MKIKRKNIDELGVGTIVLVPDEKEDMWHAYNLICVGDTVKGSTWRRINRETATGSKDTAERKKITLTIQVEKIDFNPEDGELRISGINLDENQWVKSGAYHTLVLEPNRQFTLGKTLWDSVALDRIDEACDVTARAEVCAIMVTEGICNIVSLTESMMVTTAQINVPIPKKRELSQKHHDSSVSKFFDNIFDTIIRVFNFEVVKCIIIAGPGFTKDQLLDHLIKRAEKNTDSDCKKILDNRKKFILCGASSPHKYSLKEVLADKSVLEHMSETKAAKEVLALEKFFEALQNDSDRATYGYKQIIKAHSQLAIQTLMVSDTLFRSQDIKTRSKYVELVQDVRANGSAVHIFSSLHVSGSQLDQLTGAAAILRFPIPDLDIESEEEEEVKQEEREYNSSIIMDEDDDGDNQDIDDEDTMVSELANKTPSTPNFATKVTTTTTTTTTKGISNTNSNNNTPIKSNSKGNVVNSPTSNSNPNNTKGTFKPLPNNNSTPNTNSNPNNTKGTFKPNPNTNSNPNNTKGKFNPKPNETKK